jgi:hypothetical protein
MNGIIEGGWMGWWGLLVEVAGVDSSMRMVEDLHRGIQTQQIRFKIVNQHVKIMCGDPVSTISGYHVGKCSAQTSRKRALQW